MTAIIAVIAIAALVGSGEVLRSYYQDQKNRPIKLVLFLGSGMTLLISLAATGTVYDAHSAQQAIMGYETTGPLFGALVSNILFGMFSLVLGVSLRFAPAKEKKAKKERRTIRRFAIDVAKAGLGFALRKSTLVVTGVLGSTSALVYHNYFVDGEAIDVLSVSTGYVDAGGAYASTMAISTFNLGFGAVCLLSSLYGLRLVVGKLCEYRASKRSSNVEFSHKSSGLENSSGEELAEYEVLSMTADQFGGLSALCLETECGAEVEMTVFGDLSQRKEMRQRLCDGATIMLPKGIDKIRVEKILL